MATSGRGSGMVGYNVQAAVDTTNHLIVAHIASRSITPGYLQLLGYEKRFHTAWVKSRISAPLRLHA
jgi:hypothetical protein